METHSLLKKITALLFLTLSCISFNTMYSQLGFCNGNSGDPIFTENFGTGTVNNPLPAGTTTYPYSGGFPNDGFYTVSNGTFGNGFDWHQTQDHTPGDLNGKCLIVNAGFSAGEFYRTTVNGLCETTTYEFSAWLINLVIAGSFCSNQPGGTIPINVRFEIWDGTDTNLLANGNTGNIIETSSPYWQEYGLVFQTLAGQNTVILKMINNGQGGCGNDLAIDDLEFKSCGDTIIVEDALGNDLASICSGETPYDTSFIAIPDNSVFSNHFYQWQESTNGIIWTDIVGATNPNLNVIGVTSTTYYRSKVAESAANLNNVDCITYSDIYEINVTQAPNAPTLQCWETAALNNTTCSWDISGTQPTAPTGLECWESATFNNTTCLWEVTGTQPSAPTGLECWETATFNNATCLWGVTGAQPAAPTGLECWEMATFNDTICLWEVTGTQPTTPIGLECWEMATFNDTSCLWEVTGTQPAAPTGLECWETVIFNDTTCLWEVTGTQPAAPTGLECWETATFNGTTCLWEVTGTQPVAPTGLECWETAIFNDTTCTWEVIGTPPSAPTGLECWETATFNDATCLWEVTGTQPSTPTGLECWETATFNDTTCSWEVIGTQPTQPNLECWETAIFNDTICAWEISGMQAIEPTNVNCWDDFQFNDSTCQWDNIGTENSIPIIESVSSVGNSIVITTLNTGDFEYSADGIFYQSGNVLSSLEGGQYTVYVRARNGCGVDTAEHLHFFIPSFFTPNGDTFKDTFDLKGIEFFASNEVYIFDRYGKLLKSSKNLPFKWNGTFNGQLLPSSDYWYIIIIEGQRFAGHFTLKR